MDRFYKDLISKLKKSPAVSDGQVQIISRNDHNISRDNISENALKVLYRLKKSGFEAYLVGGGVRDLLLDMNPKDFDVATDATPAALAPGRLPALAWAYVPATVVIGLPMLGTQFARAQPVSTGVPSSLGAR